MSSPIESNKIPQPFHDQILLNLLTSVYKTCNHQMHFKIVHSKTRIQNLEFVNLKCVTYAQAIPLPLIEENNIHDFYDFCHILNYSRPWKEKKRKKKHFPFFFRATDTLANLQIFFYSKCFFFFFFVCLFCFVFLFSGRICDQPCKVINYFTLLKDNNNWHIFCS